MSILERASSLFPDWDEEETKTIDRDFLEDIKLPEEEGAQTIYDTDPSKYEIELGNYEQVVEKGKEIKLLEKDGENVYAGGWPQTLFENANNEPRQPIWIGHGQRDALEGPVPIPIEFNDLFKHTALFGSTGMGKSTVMKNMMVQIAEGKHGFCFIDPKGGDSKELLEQLPEHRLDDVIWVEPSPEDFDEVVGINFLDTLKEYGEEGFEKEANSIISDVIPILRDEGYWGERMDEVVRGFLRGMLYLDEDYTIVDLYKLLVDKETRAKFSEKIEREIPERDILVKQIQSISEIDDEDLAAARRRITDWVMTDQIQQVVAHTHSSVNITKAVENGKIIIVRTASIQDEKAKEGVATVIIRRIWTAIQMRESIDKEERDPYFMFIDEFDNVVNSESDIGSILSEARSFKFGVTVANQQPSQLDRSVQENVLGNCNTLLAMNPKNPDDARVIASVFDCNSSAILNLPEFNIGTKITVDGEMKDLFTTETFPEAPPRRSKREAQDIREEIVKELGVEPASQDVEEEIEETKFEAKDDRTKETSKFKVGDDDTKMEMREILQSIYVAQIQAGGPDEFVTVGEVEETIKEFYGQASYNKLTNILTEKLETYIERRLGDEPELRLSKTGQQKAFTEDTGDSATAGKGMHRMLLQLSAELFVRLGYSYEAPKQIGEEQPDALAEPPIRPSEANSARETQKKMEELEEKYPRITEVFGYEDLAIEAEKETLDSKPKQVIKNLRKAVDNDKDCVFVVQDGKHDGESFSAKAEKAINYFSNPRFARGYRERDDDSSKKDIWYYNGSANVSIKGKPQTYALKPDSKGSIWKKDVETGELVLEDPDGGEYARLDSVDDIEHAKSEDFPFTYRYDNSQQAVIVKDRDGNEVDRFESTENKKPKEVMRENGYHPIIEPFIPEVRFETVPSDDVWHVVILPHPSRDFGPKYYDKEDKELKPVFEDDNPLSIGSIPGPDEKLEESTGNTIDKTETDRKQESSSETNKSTTEVVKQSDEVWTKPDKTDDDYNPAKDNQNYRTGYDEDRTDENWTGGQAREEDKHDDFEDYEPPEKTKPTVEDTEQSELQETIEEPTDETSDDNDTSDDEPTTVQPKGDKDDENFSLFGDLVDDEDDEDTGRTE